MLDIHFESFPTIKTKRLVLREILASDAETLFVLRAHPDVVRFLDRENDKDVHEVRHLIESMNRLLADGAGVHWGIAREGKDELIGVLSFWRIDKVNHRAEIGYILHPSAWGQGYMTEAISAALDYGFTHLKLHGVEANTSVANEASKALLLKCGFVLEAHFRENWHFNGAFLDSLIFCKLASDRSLPSAQG